MSIQQALGTRQSTFTIDSTDVNSDSGTFSGNGNILIPVAEVKSANSTDSRAIDVILDNHASAINAKENADKKQRLTSINSRLSGSNKPQLNTDKPQLNTDKPHEGITATTTNSYSNSNTSVATKLSSSARKRLIQSNRRKVDISLLSKAEENTKEQVNEIVQHDDPHGSEQIRSCAGKNHSVESDSDTPRGDTCKIRKTVSFNAHPGVYIDRPPLHFGEKGAYHNNFIKLISDVDAKIDKTLPTKTSYHHSVKSKSADESQALFNQVTGTQVRQSSSHLQPTQLQNKTRNTPVSDTYSTPNEALTSVSDTYSTPNEALTSVLGTYSTTNEALTSVLGTYSTPNEALTSVLGTYSTPNEALTSGISKTLTSQNYEKSTQIKQTPVDKTTNKDDSVTSDTHILNHSEEVKNGQPNKASVKTSLKVLKYESVLKKVETKKIIYISDSSPDKPRKSSNKVNSDRNNQETIVIRVLESSSDVVSSDIQVPRLFTPRESDETQEQLVRPLPGDSSPTRTQSITACIPLDTECDRDHVGLESNGSSIQQAARITSNMARSGTFDYANESFDDVLKERNDMEKTERVYRMRIRQLEDELKQMVHQCQELSHENKELRNTLDGIKTTKTNSDNLDVLTKLTKLESEKAKLAADYNAQLKQTDSVMLDNAKIRTASAELENNVKKLEKQVSSLNNQLNSQEIEQQRGLDAKIRELQAAVKNLEYEKKAVEARVKLLEYDNSSLTDSLESKRREIDDLTNSLQTRTVTEADLKVLQDDNNNLKQDLTEMKKKCRDLEVSKHTLQELLNEQDNMFKKANTDDAEKDKTISQLRKDLELNMQEIKRLNESQQSSRDKEKESLVSRIASLKAEIDSSLLENYKLKQDREEMAQIMDKLRQDNLNATESNKESKKYLRKWEQEKEHRSKVEHDLDKKKEEVSMLETRLKEAEHKVSILNSRIKSSEDEQDDLDYSSLNDPETDRKVLKDRNMKLRQMLVERNIELTNTKHEQTKTDSRIQQLEKKQKNAEVRVKQLSEYLGSVIDKPVQDSSSEGIKILLISRDKKSLPSRLHTNGSPQHQRKVVTSSTKQSNKVGGNEREHTTSSLPLLETASAGGAQVRNGYFTLYREKQKRSKDKGYT